MEDNKEKRVLRVELEDTVKKVSITGMDKDEKVVMKQVLDDDELDMAVGGTSAPCRPVGVLYKKDRSILSEGSPISATCAYKR